MQTISVTQAAKQLGISEDLVRYRVRAGKLIGIKVPGRGATGYKWELDAAQFMQPENGNMVGGLRAQIDSLEKRVKELEAVIYGAGAA